MTLRPIAALRVRLRQHVTGRLSPRQPESYPRGPHQGTSQHTSRRRNAAGSATQRRTATGRPATTVSPDSQAGQSHHICAPAPRQAPGADRRWQRAPRRDSRFQRQAPWTWARQLGSRQGGEPFHGTFILPSAPRGYLFRRRQEKGSVSPGRGLPPEIPVPAGACPNG